MLALVTIGLAPLGLVPLEAVVFLYVALGSVVAPLLFWSLKVGRNERVIVIVEQHRVRIGPRSFRSADIHGVRARFGELKLLTSTGEHTFGPFRDSSTQLEALVRAIDHMRLPAEEQTAERRARKKLHPDTLAW